MINILQRITALIILLVAMIFGFLPDEKSPIVVPTENIEIISNTEGVDKGGKYVFDNYDEFRFYCLTVNQSKEMEEYAESLGKEYFEEHNLVIVDVVLADIKDKTYFVSAKENNETLNIGYSIVALDAGDGVVCVDSICVKASKNITKVTVVEMPAPTA